MSGTGFEWLVTPLNEPHRDIEESETESDEAHRERLIGVVHQHSGTQRSHREPAVGLLGGGLGMPVSTLGAVSIADGIATTVALGSCTPFAGNTLSALGTGRLTVPMACSRQWWPEVLPSLQPPLPEHWE